jgi:hypothetical protein
MASATPIKPAKEEPQQGPIDCDILDWQLALGENDPHRLAQVAVAGATLACLVVEGIHAGEDNGADPDLAERLLRQIAHFNAGACERLARLVAGRA